MSGQLHALAALPPEKEPLVPVLGNPDHVWYIIIFMLNIEFYDFFIFVISYWLCITANVVQFLYKWRYVVVVVLPVVTLYWLTDVGYL